MNKEEMIKYLTKNYGHIWNQKEIKEIAVEHIKENAKLENDRFECMTG